MKDLKEAAKEFCKEDGMLWEDIFIRQRESTLRVSEYLSQFVQHLVDKGDLMTSEDYNRFKDEYKAEVNLDALCCAVADVEKEHDKINHSNENHIASLENQVKLYQKIVDNFIDSKAKVITDEELFDISVNAYCKHSEVEGFIFTTFQGRKSQEESNGYCSGYQNGHSDGIKWYRDQLNKKS